MRTSAAMAVAVVAVAAAVVGRAQGYTCLNEQGKSVDWFVAFKVNNGADYYYADASSPSRLSPAAKAMDGTAGSVASTVNQLYKKLPAKHGYFVYNDDTDQGATSNTRAHAKGVVMFDKSQGFWLIHSLPRYPARRSSGYQGLPDIKFGQTFLCVTYNTEMFDEIGRQIAMMHPLPYDSSLVGLDSVVPGFADLLRSTAPRGRNVSPSSSNVLSLTSAGGQKMTHFGKSRKFDGNLYEDLVATGLKKAIYVETWMNGDRNNRMSSFFPPSGYDVIQVQTVTMPDGKVWKESQDHSKWAVTVKPGSVCIGDINRQYSQQNRGGGTMCIASSSLWKAVHPIVLTTDPIPESNNEEDSTKLTTHYIVALVGGVLVVAGAVAVFVIRKRRAPSVSVTKQSHYRAFASKPPKPSGVSVVV